MRLTITSAFQSLYGPILSADENGMTEATVCLPSLMVLVATGAVAPVARSMLDSMDMRDSMSLAMTVVFTTLRRGFSIIKNRNYVYKEPALTTAPLTISRATLSSVHSSWGIDAAAHDSRAHSW